MKYAHLDRLSTEALEELLCADIKSPDDDDDEVVLHILEVIEQREKAIPTGRLSDVDKALEEFQTYYNIPEMNGVTLYPEETAESVTDAVTMVGFIPKRPWIRVLGTIAATVIFMFAMLIGAQAAGIDVFGAIGRWTDETFHFVSFPHSIPQDQETTAPNLENVETCNVIKGALKDCEIPEELAPTWYPVGIEASDPKILSDKLSDTVHIFFSDGDMLFFNLNNCFVLLPCSTISKASSSRFSRCCGCSFIGRNCTLSLALILGHVIANLLLNRGGSS